MAAFDAIVRRGTLPGAPGEAPVQADIGIADGRIAAVSPGLEGGAGEELDAGGLHVLPGVVDAHVHLDEPGRTHWEGWDTGTSALAAGGATSCVDMPFNAIPPTTSMTAFDLKLERAERFARIDFGLWGGIVPGNAAALPELAARGVLGFKAFMCDTGLEEFPGCDDLDLLDGMRAAAALGLPALVHAESQAITAGLAARARAAGRRGIRDVIASRPAVAEVQAVARALALAQDAACRLHVVHVSTGAAVALVAEARARGVDASCEVCPHHLVLGEEDAERLGALAVCTPPLRSEPDREALWAGLADGRITSVASDHSPTTPDRKASGDPWAVWGGIAGAQATLELLLTEGHHARGLPLARIAQAVAAAPAGRFALAGKGRLEPGADADLVLVDLSGERRLDRGELLQRHPGLSPYLGRSLRARVVRTLLRGRTVVAEGRTVGPPAGRLLRPAEVGQ